MKQKFFTLVFSFCLFFFGSTLVANNVVISNTELTGQNAADDYVMVKFDLSWENSWRTSSAPFNWDAVWVFVKYRVANGDWQHAKLSNTGHSGTGATIEAGLLSPNEAYNSVSNPAVGAFVYRSADGTGNFSITGAQLRWNYGVNGLADNAIVDIQVFAIEMVYMPEGPFYVGSGGTETGSFTNGFWTSGASTPLRIQSEDQLTIQQSTGCLWGTSSTGSSTIGGTGTLAAQFPKGFGAFYCMKHEISQKGYVDFLNNLTTAQASARYPNQSINRQGITVSAGVYSTSNPYVACNFLSWMDGAAYTDWAGLRPMTELEFEKACRGTVTPVADEYAWGNTTITAANNITNAGAVSETSNTSGANAVYGNQTNVQGPMRVGVFASGATSRVQAGSSYYGILELNGNLSEQTVTTGNAEGRAFTGVHGNGAISANGYANQTAWPGIASGEVSGATGSGVRGNGWDGSVAGLCISSRINAVSAVSARYSAVGFRGVRSFPAPFVCGVTSVGIQHTTVGGVAPEAKSVLYGTITNIPGETTKCWITKNLGASQQATAVDDATESSAGWYWQFNRKQGYKHDGTNRTPNTTWITPISESSDWTTANDPCSIELGTGWRLPTSTEWTNVDGASGGNWTNWNGPWNSALKLHATGYLSSSGGSLYFRGAIGFYWSNAQNGSSDGWHLYLYSGGSIISNSSKADGFSARCLRNLLPVLTTTSATSIDTTSASSGGNITDDGGSAVTARGVCWSTSTGPTIALSTKTEDGSGTGSFTSSLTNLTSNTTYYIRAYATSANGTAYGNEVSFTTLTPFVCGTSTITKNHLASGGVAPVDKSVTYGTVTNIPGETSKCWITKNLGATQQPSSASDATEASAGWYWQWNRKQGYKHDGTTRTPSTAWDGTADGETNWNPSNDPCALELGTGWRLPTITEWNNVDAYGGWTNSTGPYNSDLKLHMGGALSQADGSLWFSGTTALYWSSNTYGTLNNGTGLMIQPTYSGQGNTSKATGATIRCLRNWLPVLTTTSATSITATTASSGGSITDDGGSAVTARGVCWSTSTGPTIALSTKTTDGSGTGSFTSSITGLSYNTYYLRAYATTANGTAYGNEVSFTTPLSCGTSTLAISHVTADGVGAVDKSVTYGTVTSIPGETTKCWITKNLGASQEATAVSDNTEASAGWYWQFNRKQGYKHDGTTRTPNTTWVTSISESSDWPTANDPCAIELGTGWRLPTNTEWTNVDGTSGGSWINWNGPWNSALKLHAAGDLDGSNGSLYFRGSGGYYWSNTQLVSSSGWSMTFSSGHSDMYSNSKANGFTVRCIRDLLPVLTTTSATSITTTTASSGGNITDDGSSAVTARGVCWSTSTGPTIALSTKTTDGSGTGSFTSSITGLSYNTYYVRAYATTANGTSYGNEVSFTTLFSCGTSTITKNHLASGGVAPVDKIVTYGTVTSIPGETTKCWITKNLGASQQATAVDDATEASAGWYWQFNRKQGYKHDGVTLTPAWSVTSISESSDWTTANDPCANELGTGWRLPTSTEWANVDGTSGGNWTNWNGPWTSALKLHAAGCVRASDGSLQNRGAAGYYWSSAQNAAAYGWVLIFYSGGSIIGNSSKADGFSARCLRNLLPVLTTTSATSITTTTASSGGNITDDGGSAVTARGVCWSTSTGPTIALSTKTTDGSGTGSFTSSLTNLTSNTTYYIRAYATSANGTAYGNEVSFTTLAPFVCGTSTITKNHLASGGVAPVDKSVTYGTVTNIPGETSKCWITRNLGASQQATALTDATEASAGWYWQFNRKQGYKHDGTTLTPAWTITSISETSDWLTTNDPCAIELGTGWRLPTSTEWTNVSGGSGGNWGNGTGAWNSALKLHAAGYLNYPLGSLLTRGVNGYCWSGTQYDLSRGYNQNFSAGSCYIYYISKAYGISLRCLRD